MTGVVPSLCWRMPRRAHERLRRSHGLKEEGRDGGHGGVITDAHTGKERLRRAGWTE